LRLAAVPPQSGAALGTMTGGEGHWRRGRRLAVVAAAIAASSAQAQDRTPKGASPPPCNLAVIGTATVGKMIDARTLMLSDGRELRLAGIEAPERDEPHAPESKSAIESIVAGREIVLQRLGTDSDRHGRTVALVSLASEPDKPSVQHQMLAAGHARVAGRVGNFNCAKGFWRAENSARAAGLGLWSLPYYGVRRAEHVGEVLAYRCATAAARSM
jgi:endonuclease YncB( thermonuclease family)